MSKKLNVVKRAGIFILLLTIVIIINCIIPQMGAKMTYDGTDFFSGLVGDNEKRSVNGGESGRLTYGPYITFSEGQYTIQVYYSTDTDGNTVDMVSGPTVYYKNTLKKEETIHVFKLDVLQPIQGVEIRTSYVGKGNLAVEKVVIQNYNKELASLIKWFNIIFSVVISLYIGYWAGTSSLLNSEKKRTIIYYCIAYCIAAILIFFIVTLIYVSNIIF